MPSPKGLVDFAWSTVFPFALGIAMTLAVQTACSTPTPPATPLPLEAPGEPRLVFADDVPERLLSCTLTERRGLLSVELGGDGACDAIWSNWLAEPNLIDALALRCFEAACGPLRSVDDETAEDWDVTLDPEEHED